MVNLIVDNSAIMSDEQRRATKAAAIIAISALNPSGFFSYYTLDSNITLQYTGYVNEIGVQLLVDTEQISNKTSADGNVLFNFLQQQQVT